MTDALLSSLARNHVLAPTTPFWFCIMDDAPPPTIADIKARVVRHYGISMTDITSARRGRTGLARQVAMYLAYRLTEHTHAVIARKFKKCDHTVSLFACKQVRARIQRDENFSAEIAKLEASFA